MEARDIKRRLAGIALQASDYTDTITVIDQPVCRQRKYPLLLASSRAARSIATIDIVNIVNPPKSM